MQTRPCPTFGRPVHLGSPHRLRPGTSPHALQIPSHDGHPALRSITSSGFRSALAVSSFRLCARLDVSIPSAFFGQRGFIPAFGYGAPHSSVRGTLTLLNNMLLSSHSFLVRLFHSLLHAGLSRRTAMDFAATDLFQDGQGGLYLRRAKVVRTSAGTISEPIGCRKPRPSAGERRWAPV